MKPLFHPRPWGASELGPIYPNHKFAERIGEAWLTGDNCIVANGVLAGQKLEAVTLQLGRALVGDAARDVQHFPLL
jgi:mannose-6-phosphate isomerase